MLTLASFFTAGILSSGCCSGSSCSGMENRQTAITNVLWKLKPDSLSGIGKTTEMPDRDVTFRIDKNGMVSGCAGVNRYFGSTALNQTGKSLKFGSGLGATKMAGKGMAFEDAYLKMLSRVVSYDNSGNLLRFKDKNGKNLAVFEPAPEK